MSDGLSVVLVCLCVSCFYHGVYTSRSLVNSGQECAGTEFQ